MTYLRPLLAICIAILPALAAGPAAAVPADMESATAGSGGALASPLEQGEGGGGVAPPAPAVEASDSPGGDAGTPAAPSQEPTPTTPEGEEQPGEEEPPAEEQEEEEGEGVEKEIIGPVGEDPGSGSEAGSSAGSFLPSTGLEIAALGAIGLGLLTVGAAIRPRRRVTAGRR